MPQTYDRRWKWRVRFYYRKDVSPPKVPESLAIETVHETDSSMQIEVSAGSSRDDIGRIEITRLYGRD